MSENELLRKFSYVRFSLRGSYVKNKVMEYLISSNGRPFDSEKLKAVNDSLDKLSDEKRTEFRNENALAIAQDRSERMLIVSGPGTGKSTIFKQRIDYWLQASPLARVLALSFVKKLVVDLKSDIQGDDRLKEEQKERVDVLTLHGYARSVVERNHGILRLQFKPHLRIIDGYWQEMVWQDAMLVSGLAGSEEYAWWEFKKQLYDSGFLPSEQWKSLRRNYYAICKYYNAAGFADLIIHARVALSENAALKEHEYFIIDEFQDFNKAEEMLINELTSGAIGVLTVGDDDQVLYDKLKSGRASIIRGAYRDESLTNAMLPFCSRSVFHIAKTASYFIQQKQEANQIEKIYLPLSTDASCSKVQMIACSDPLAAVDYIAKFVSENRSEIEARKDALSHGTAKDPFLLILTPSRELKFYASKNPRKDARESLRKIVAEFAQEEKKFSEDYYKTITYYSLAKYPDSNYTFRKVLSYEVDLDIILPMIKAGLETEVDFFQMKDDIVATLLAKCNRVKAIIDSDGSTDEKVEKIKGEIVLSNADALRKDLERQSFDESALQSFEYEEEERAELEELKASQMSAIELMSITGSKGLSADHVIIIGFDDVNMSWVTRNAFYVGLTRARKSLHIITAASAGGAQYPHDFLDDLPVDHLEFHKYVRSAHQKTALATRDDFKRYFRGLNYAKSQGKKK